MGMTEKGLYDIYDTWHVPFWQTTWFYVLVGSLVGLIVLFITYLIIKKIKSRAKKQLPFWQQALQKIQQLKKENKVSVDQSKEFYAQLTVTLKKYIAERYKLDVESKTDDELVAYLSDQNLFDNSELNDLRSIFTGSTTIKFAHAQAAQDQIERDYRNAVEFIKNTRVESS